MALEVGFVPHLNLAFALSLLTIAIGIGLYLASDGVRSALRIDPHGDRLGAGQGLRPGDARAVARRLSGDAADQSGRLDYYMTVTVMVFVAALFGPMVFAGAMPQMPAFPVLKFYEWTVLALIVLGIVAVVVARNRLTAIVSLGIQGFAIALIFMLLGAPDLSFTQFMVETLSVVILALVMTRLKLSVGDHRPWREVLPDAALALGGGAGFALFLLSIVQRPFDAKLSDFFERYSYAVAHGHNIVNVIIVDFRGIDTMGEIAVVMTTGLAVLALIRVRVGQRTPSYPDPAEESR